MAVPDSGTARAYARGVAAAARRDLAYVVCALLATAAIWGHRYPAGIDLPQHANLFRLWHDLSRGPLEYRGLYRVDGFTPYLLAYVIAYPWTLVLGAVAAVKCLLTLSALGTPLMMRRWLKVVGGRQELGLFGFLLAFDFQYQCGFLAQSVAMPLMFGYLAACEGQGPSPSWRAMVRATLWGGALFFCHGITFGVCLAAMALSLTWQRRSVSLWRRGLHALPLAAVALLWLAARRQQTVESPASAWFGGWERLVTLFSGPFVAFPSRSWAAVSLAALVVLLVVTRPRLVLDGRRSAPLLLATACFLVLPETMAATMVIASRFCVFIHAFAPAALAYRPTDWLRRQSARVIAGMVAAGLLLLNARLYSFNEELVGLRELATHMEAGADVGNVVPQTFPHSDVFGPMQLGQAPAWLTAEHGGLIDDDSAKYYQVPLKRNPVPFPTRQRYIVARGNVRRASVVVGTRTPHARLIHQSTPWLLFEDPLAGTGDVTVLRTAQTWRQLRVDRSVVGAPLSIAGVRYSHGLGTHAQSFIRLRIDRAGHRLTGACGIDDQALTSGKAVFRIRDDAGAVLFATGEVRGGQPARRFSVVLAGRRELLLEVLPVRSGHYAHADWVELQVQDSP